jgi:hypothetical protein
MVVVSMIAVFENQGIAPVLIQSFNLICELQDV